MSSDERLARLGLLHLADDPEALFKHAQKTSAELAERARKWNAQQAPNYEKWIRENSSHDGHRSGLPTLLPGEATGTGESGTFLSSEQRADPEVEIPVTHHEVRSAWERCQEIGWWTPDLDPALVQNIQRLSHALSALLDAAGQRAVPGSMDLLTVAVEAEQVRLSIGDRALRWTSGVALLLQLSDGIVRGALER